MANNRDNAVVLVLNAPESDLIPQSLKDAFGSERALHTSKDLYLQAYDIANSFKDAIKIIAYSKTAKYPDLTWLSCEDPGFLECHGKSYSEMLMMAASLAFTTGCRKVVYINHLCPFITQQHIDFAFSKINEKNCVVGASEKGGVYLVGISRENLKILENFDPYRDSFLEEVLEKAKRNKASIIGMEDLVIVKDEATLKTWLEAKSPTSSVFSDILKKVDISNHKRKRKEKHIEEQGDENLSQTENPQQGNESNTNQNMGEK